jgi:hypothetical protein
MKAVAGLRPVKLCGLLHFDHLFCTDGGIDFSANPKLQRSAGVAAKRTGLYASAPAQCKLHLISFATVHNKLLGDQARVACPAACAARS